jgi:hypothetical protein
MKLDFHSMLNLDDARRELSEFGFANLGIHRPDLPAEEAIARLGLVASACNRTPIERLRASEVGEKGLNTYGGNFGRDALPLHTDLAHWFRPPRYLVLRCDIPDARVPTNVLSSLDALAGLRPEIVARALFKPRRPLSGKVFLLRLVQNQIFRWDSLFLVASNREAETVREHARNEWGRRAKNIVLAERGHTIVIDNWQALHGRGASPSSHRERVVHRAYLSELSLDNYEDPRPMGLRSASHEGAAFHRFDA